MHAGGTRRNEALRRLIASKRNHACPRVGTSRGSSITLGQEPHLSELAKNLDVMCRKLARAVPDLGKDTRATLRRWHARIRKERPAGGIAEGLPSLAAAGRNTSTTRAGDKDRRGVGYKLHLLVDVKHECVGLRGWTPPTRPIAVAAELGETGSSEPARRSHPTLAYDKAADDNESHRVLNKAGIRPVTKTAACGRSTEQMLPGTMAARTSSTDEAGTGLLLRSHEPADRAAEDGLTSVMNRTETIKYRCPARHEGWPCPHRRGCATAGKSYGKTVRGIATIDLRRFPPIPAGDQKVRAASTMAARRWNG